MLQESIINPDTAKMMAHIFIDKARRIILFPVVKDYNYSETYLLDLDTVLTQFKLLHQYRVTDVLIIPVAELSRRHFRLLTIAKSQINYYDSKNTLINIASRAVGPLRPAALEAYNLTEHKYEEEVNACEPMPQDAPSAFSILSTLVRFSLISRSIGYFSLQMIGNYSYYLDPVKQTCAKHFPDYPFQEQALGHQAFNQHTDCGPLTASYAEKIANDFSPFIATEDAIVLRARYYGHRLDDSSQSEDIDLYLEETRNIRP